jgi:hypothetical protein
MMPTKKSLKEKALVQEKQDQAGICGMNAGHGCRRCRFSMWLILLLIAVGVCQGICWYHHGSRDPGLIQAPVLDAAPKK